MDVVLTLNLEPEVEAGLIAQAQAAGLTVENYLLRVVNEKAGVLPGRILIPEEWAEQFEVWADSFAEAAPVPDTALSRDNMYPDRW